MALIGINPARPRDRKPSVLEQVALGLDVASKALGLGVSGYDLLKNGTPGTQAAKKADLEKFNIFRPASPGEVPEFTQDGQGLVKRPDTLDPLKAMLLSSQIGTAKREAALPKVSKAQEAMDAAVAKDMAEFDALGGYAQFQKNIDRLNEAKQMLLNLPDATGGIGQALTKGLPSIQGYLYPETASIKDSVLEPVQGNLKLTLGSQFTEKEGAKIEGRSFREELSPQENASRIDRIIKQMQKQMDSKLKAFEHFRNFQTLEGFKGNVPNQNDFDSILPDLTKDQMKKIVEAGKTLEEIPTKPKIVIQNGVTYTLNPETGEYE